MSVPWRWECWLCIPKVSSSNPSSSIFPEIDSCGFQKSRASPANSFTTLNISVIIRTKSRFSKMKSNFLQIKTKLIERSVEERWEGRICISKVGSSNPSSSIFPEMDSRSLVPFFFEKFFFSTNFSMNILMNCSTKISNLFFYGLAIVFRLGRQHCW